jgi:hypothetical protein
LRAAVGEVDRSFTVDSLPTGFSRKIDGSYRNNGDSFILFLGIFYASYTSRMRCCRPA